MRSLSIFSSCPRWLTILLAGLAVAGIGGIDYVTGYRVSLGLLYVLPVFVAAWCVSRSAATGISLLSAVAWFLADIGARGLDLFEPVVAWNALVRLGFFLIVAHLASSLRLTLQKSEDLARTDATTGVGNVRLFYERAQEEIERSRRRGYPLTITYMDLDDFKKVNDLFGHCEGDRVLRVTAGTLRKSLRVMDIVARLGGDEFAILLPETDGAHARNVLERIQEKLLSAMAEGKWPVSFSMGAVTFRTPPVSVGEMILRADTLMYAVKSDGKNGYRHEVSWEPPGSAPGQAEGIGQAPVGGTRGIDADAWEPAGIAGSASGKEAEGHGPVD